MHFPLEFEHTELSMYDAVILDSIGTQLEALYNNSGPSQLWELY